MTEETPAMRALIAKIDCIDKKLDSLTAGRQDQAQEPRPMSKRRARRLRRERKFEDMLTYITSGLAFVWSMFSRAFGWICFLVHSAGLSILVAYFVLGASWPVPFLFFGKLVHPMLPAFLLHPVPPQLFRNITELLARLTVARNGTDFPDL